MTDQPTPPGPAGPARRTVVVPWFYAQYRNWCAERGWNPNDRKLIVVLDGQPDKVRGLVGPKRGGDIELVLLEGAGKRDDFDRVVQSLRASGFEI